MTCCEKVPNLKNKTRMKFLVENIFDDNVEAALVDFLHKYIKVLKREKPWREPEKNRQK
jgi:hypothetical protein